ncbi:MAG: SNF2-related protein [Candidatus Parvarchaeota archaeon]
MLLRTFNGVFVVESRYEEKDILKSFGFRWNPEIRRWWTDDYKKVNNLLNSVDVEVKATPEVKELLGKIESDRVNTLNSSISTSTEFVVDVPEGYYVYPYQKAGIEFIYKHKKALLADDMGLGKTIEAIGLINLTRPKSILIVTPKIALSVWEYELKRWLTLSYNITVNDGIQNEGIVLMNYEKLLKYENEVTSRSWDLIILDESQYIKNFRSKRTKIALKLKGDRKLLLTGTPILNHPEELFTQLRFLDHPLANSFKEFADNFLVPSEWGGYQGGKNLGILQQELRSTVMIRRTKDQVLKELPAKIRQIIVLPSYVLKPDILEENKKYLQVAKTILEGGDSTKIITETIGTVSPSFVFEEISRIRHLTALAKLPLVVEQIRDILDNDVSLVVFAHHKDVIEEIHREFPNSVVITGETSDSERTRNVESFQNGNVPLIIVSMHTAGTAITLTRASICLFAELDWTPSVMIQSEDRLHRIGQKESVQAQYIVVDGTIDKHITDILKQKSNEINQTINWNMIKI